MTNEELLRELDNFSGDNIQPTFDIIDEYMYPIQAFLKYMDTLRETKDCYGEQLSFCDQAREDILHYLEFHTTNAVERTKLINKLMAVQKTRRAIKVRMECLQVIGDTWLGANYLKTHKDLTNVLTRLNSMNQKTYGYRTTVVQDTIGGSDET